MEVQFAAEDPLQLIVLLAGEQIDTSVLAVLDAAVLDCPSKAYTRKYIVVFCGKPDGETLVLDVVTVVGLVKLLDVEY